MSLYTKVLIDDAIGVIKSITNDGTAKLIDICLRSTYFSFRGDLYEQVDGVAMGSPLSPIVANLYMEYFKGKALNS